MTKPSVLELEKQAAELRKLINLSAITLAPLESDFNFALEHSRKEQNHFWSRTALRCLCAAVEARLFTFRKMAEQLGGISGVQFDAKEVEILTEQRIVIEQSGAQSIKRRSLPFPDSVKESFRLFGKAVGATLVLTYGTGYSRLCETFELRNRLMHPKAAFDVEVRADQIDTGNRGIEWFNEAYTGVLEQCQAQIQQRIATKLKSRGA